MSDLPENEKKAEAGAIDTEASGINAEASAVEEVGKDAFSLKKEVFEWIYTIAVALIIAFLIKGFLFDIVRVDGESMYPTLMNNDRLVVTKIGYKPQQKDIIILDSTYHKRREHYEALEMGGKSYNWFTKAINYFSLPENLKIRYYVKRVIALPGQTVDIQDGNVYVDGELLEEEYYDGVTSAYDPAVQFPLTVEDGYVFVMGDNRGNSKDSRSSSLGQIPYKAILGKAQLRIWPFNSIGVTR
ncbi:MAG: signal peptidase I [Clostridia bacterium]|nr:signal peptidase I [Clostridia bacterium]